MARAPRHRTFFITGAAGFVGSRLLRALLDQNQDVYFLKKPHTPSWRIDDLLSHPHAHLCEGDLTDQKKLTTLLTTIQPDVIYHLAARGAYSNQNDPDDIFETNVIGTSHLLAALSDIKYELFVHAGSSSEYGYFDTPMRECDPIAPASYYAIAKAAATQLCRYTAESQQKPIVTLRLFSVYGPGEEPSRLIPTVLRSLDKQLPLSLVSPQIARDFIYVDDVVNLFLQIDRLKKFPGETFNLGTGIQSTLEDTVRTAEHVTGKTTALQWGAMPARRWDTVHWVADMSKTHQKLGWRHQFSLAAGLEQMWQWSKKNQSDMVL